MWIPTSHPLSILFVSACWYLQWSDGHPRRFWYATIHHWIGLHERIQREGESSICPCVWWCKCMAFMSLCVYVWVWVYDIMSTCVFVLMVDRTDKLRFFAGSLIISLPLTRFTRFTRFIPPTVHCRSWVTHWVLVPPPWSPLSWRMASVATLQLCLTASGRSQHQRLWAPFLVCPPCALPLQLAPAKILLMHYVMTNLF